MLRKLKKYLSKRHFLKNTGNLPKIAKYLRHRELWQFHPNAMAKGAAAGLFVAFIPLPGQSVIAALLAYVMRANLPLAIALTWISNPFTFIPLNYAIYKVGKWLTGDTLTYQPLADFHWRETAILDIGVQVLHWFSAIGKPFLIGSFVLAIFSSLIGFVLVHACWHLVVISKKVN